MRAIKVKYQPNSDVLSMVVNGECNHANYEVEIEEEDHISIDGTDQSYKEYFDVCKKCGSWRKSSDFDNQEWEGIGYFPAPYITNSGKLVLR